ncbi:MAG: glycosyltransferase family 2 protein, partial [Paracoccaceae bacterium]
VVGFEDRPVTEVFTRAAPAVLHWPWRAAMFKTLFRNDGAYGKLGVHRPRSPVKPQVAVPRWFDGSGRELPVAFHTGRIFSDFGQDNYGLVQLNHYALGAMESYLVKCDRGRANREASSFDMGYWVERNFCDVEDRTVLGLTGAAALRAELASDAVLRPLHAAAVAWRHQRFAELMADEPWRGLFGRLLMTPPSRAISKAEARLIWRHGRGIGVAKPD